MILNQAQQTLTSFLKSNVAADPIAAAVPAQPVAWAGYVWPASDWVRVDDDAGTFCVRYQVRLVLDLCAGVVDLQKSQNWLNDRVEEVLTSCASGVEVAADELVFPEGAEIVGIVGTANGTEVLAARVPFTPFTLEVE